jgi:hypothetical protein
VVMGCRHRPRHEARNSSDDLLHIALPASVLSALSLFSHLSLPN